MSNFDTLAPLTQGNATSAPTLFIASTTDNLGAITATGYLNDISKLFKQNDLVYVNYLDTTTNTLATFYVNVSGGNYTLTAFPVNGFLLASNNLSDLTNFVTARTNIGLFGFDITVGQAALAAAGSVTLVASSGSKQFKIRTLELESGGTNFSGGGGDRLGQVTDSTTVYSVVPAATMQALVNARWGVTALPNAASAANNTSTAAGAALVFKYSGGATDYTAGSLRISGVVERVA